MAVNHITFNPSTQHGQILRSALTGLENGLKSLNDVIDVMAVMIDGDGSLAAHFPYVTSRFNFTTDAESKAAYEELNSLAAKLNSDASVTNVNAALQQAFSKFR